MKRLAMLTCVLVIGNCFAQEEKHIQGSENKEIVENNKILEIVKKREQMVTVINVYPNPSQGQLFVEGTPGSEVTVYSVEGTYVGTWIINNESKVEITDLPNGTFLCAINDGTTRTVKRIVVL